MNCQELQEIIQSGGSLDEASAAHLENCGGCRTFADRDAALSDMFASLPSKDAPVDFDFGVRARIAAEKEPRSWVWAALRFGVPSAAMALIVGLAVLNSSLFNSGGGSTGKGMEIVGDPAERPVFKIEEVKQDPNGERVTEAGGSDAAGETAPVREPGANAKEPAELVRRPSRDEPGPGRDQKPSPEIRSIDQGVEEPKVINPPGLDPDREITPPVADEQTTFTFIEILSALGVSAAWEDGGLIVSDVAARSTGQRSGLRKGDRILAIDGVAVSQNPVRGAVSGSSILISRSGRRMLISIGARN